MSPSTVFLCLFLCFTTCNCRNAFRRRIYGIPGTNCFDSISTCSRYRFSMCHDDPAWAKHNCRYYCNYCKVCVDKIATCSSYGLKVCEDDPTWSEHNCPNYCNFCENTVTTTKTHHHEKASTRKSTITTTHVPVTTLIPTSQTQTTSTTRNGNFIASNTKHATQGSIIPTSTNDSATASTISMTTKTTKASTTTSTLTSTLKPTTTSTTRPITTTYYGQSTHTSTMHISQGPNKTTPKSSMVNGMSTGKSSTKIGVYSTSPVTPLSCDTCYDMYTLNCSNNLKNCNDVCMLREKQGRLSTECIVRSQCEYFSILDALSHGKTTCCTTEECFQDNLKKAIKGYLSGNHFKSTSTSATTVTGKKTLVTVPVTTP